jgi:hypothetical protein
MSEELTKSNKDRRLTLDEMYDIFMGDAYKEWHEILYEGTNGKKHAGITVLWHNPRFSPLLYRHIIAEELLGCDKEKVDWDKVGLFEPCHYFEFIDLLMNPLVWKDALDYEDIVVEGRIAEEEYDSGRFKDIVDLLNYIGRLDIIDFAKDPYEYDEDSYEMKHVKGMHEWGRLTCDMEDIFHKIINGEHTTYEEIRGAKYYDLASLRYRLTVIAKECGGKRAVELLSMLQEEWPKIKLWKTYFDTMEPEDIEHFENGLFHGFDDLLAEWNQEAEQSSTRGPKETTVFKDSETAEREKERFISFINRHKMSEDDVDAAWDNRVNQVAVCFYRVWKEKKMLTTKAGGTSLSRFIIDCGLSISVKEKAHGNALNRMINSTDLFTNWIGDVRASFSK